MMMPHIVPSHPALAITAFVACLPELAGFCRHKAGSIITSDAGRVINQADRPAILQLERTPDVLTRLIFCGKQLGQARIFKQRDFNFVLEKFLDDKNFSLVIGDFNIMLPGVLEKLNKLDYAFIDGNHAYEPTISYFMKLLPYAQANSVFIFHDIYWSKGMEAAWNEIKDNPKVTITIDLFYMGIIFFRQGIPKQNFILRF